MNERITIAGCIVDNAKEPTDKARAHGQPIIRFSPSERPSQLNIDYAALEHRVLAACTKEKRP